MKVGDLVRVKYDGIIGLIVRIEESRWLGPRSLTPESPPWTTLRIGDVEEDFRADRLEVINESR